MRRRQVKICGIRNPQAALAAVEAGADMVGLNLVPGSRRSITIAYAKRLLPLLAPIRTVALFQDQSEEAIRSSATEIGLQWIQLHGQESPELCRDLSRQFSIIKALHKEQALDRSTTARFAPFVEIFLIDGKEPGSGQGWDWGSLAHLKGSLEGRPLWLAGGINIDNVASIIQRATPMGIDSASGVEREGQQDPELIAQFCRLVKGS